MKEYTLLEGKVNGKLIFTNFGEINIPIKIMKVEFVGFQPTKIQRAYYQQIPNQEAGLPESEIVCDVIVYYNDLSFPLNEGDFIRAQMNKESIAIADSIEKIN